MKSFVDNLTNIINASVNLLFIGYPNRTSLGALFGLFAKVLVKIFQPMLLNVSYINLLSLKDWEFVIIGIAVFHIPTFVSQVIGKNKLSENEEKAFEIIRQAKKAGISEWEIQNMYLKLAEKVLNNIDLKQNTKEELQKMTEQ